MPIRSNYYIPEPIIKKLRKMADKRDVSMSQIVREALQEYIVREERKLKK